MTPSMSRYCIQLQIVILLSFTVLFGCKTKTLPIEKFNQYEYHKSYTYKDDTLKVELKNPLHCPLRVWLFSSNIDLQKEFNQSAPILLESESDTILTYSNIKNFDNQLRFSSRLGSLLKKIEPIKVEFPFQELKEYTVIQENNTNFTHNSDWSRYALDFDMKTNDTICSATNGYVVGVVDQYKHSGKGQEWKPFANYLTIYEPNSGIFCQYVHLVQNGSLVKLGDKIELGQKIALSGNTGHSTIEHLHFSCLIPVNTENGLKSIPIEFVGGQKGIELKKGDKVKKE